MGRSKQFMVLAVIIYFIIIVTSPSWNPMIDRGDWHSPAFSAETVMFGGFIVALVISAIVIGPFAISDINREIQEEQRITKQRELEAKKQQKAAEEWKARQEAAEKIAKPILIDLEKRIRALLRENAGEFFDEMEIQSRIGVTTASENNLFGEALRRACGTLMAIEKGYLCKRKEIGYETYRWYYYYVNPNE